MSYKLLIIVPLLFLHFNSISGLRCFECEDEPGQTQCRENYKNVSTIRICESIESNQKNPLSPIDFYKLNNDEKLTLASGNNWKCALGETSDGTMFGRGCTNNCTSYKMGNISVNIQCCDDNLCNSSFKINIGIFNLSLGFITIALFGK